jgi:hypothetical protein
MGLDDRDYMRQPENRTPNGRSGRRSSSGVFGFDGGLVLGVILIVVGLGALILKRFDPPEPIETDDALGDLTYFDPYYNGGYIPVDVNEATRDQLILLPMISPRIADGIIARRPFRLTEDLLDVKGIGELNLEIIRLYLYGFEDQPEPRQIKPPNVPDA